MDPLDLCQPMYKLHYSRQPIYTDRSLVSGSGAVPGYMLVELEPYGFDTDVIVIIQPYGEFFDYVKSYRENMISSVYRAAFSSKFYVP